MSTSPLPPDPYEALGVSRDADVESIKKAHRKLVLKHHPDRIKDPDLIEENKNAFQKVQQAYELLVDPVLRARYEDQCKLAQLRKERLMNDARDVQAEAQAQAQTRAREAQAKTRDPRPTYTRTTYQARASPAPAQPVPRETPMPREMRSDPRYATPAATYEERTPDSYFDSRAYEEPPLRPHKSKAESHDRRSSGVKPAEKREKEKTSKATAWEKPGGLSYKQAFFMKEKATNAKKKVEEKLHHAHAAKARDKEERSNRNEKTYGRFSPHVDEFSTESSEGDTILTEGRKPTARNRSPVPPKSKRNLTPEPPRRRGPSPRPDREKERERQREPERVRHQQPSYEEESESESEDEKWERHHRQSKEYIAAAVNVAASKTGGRPSLSRQNSDNYWMGADGKEHRRSGSDSDRQRNERPPPPTSHKSHRRSAADESEARARPTLATQSSAPPNLKPTARAPDREPTTRPRQNSYDSRSYRKEMADKMPPLQRAGSDPISAPRTASKRDNAPLKGSSLKQTETNHDSGYGSGSSPQTPETRGDSPPNESKMRETSRTTYRATNTAGDGLHRARQIPNEDGGDIHRFLSPETAEIYRGPDEKRERRRSRSREAQPRSRSNRPEQGERRPSISRGESSSRHDGRSHNKVYTDRSPDRNGYIRVDPSNVKIANHRNPTAPKYSNHYDEHHGLFSRGRMPSFHVFS